MVEEQESLGPPRRLAVACLVASIAALVVALYLTWEHYRDPSGAGLVCPASAAINCVKVTTSPQAYFLGIPVALLGSLFYAGLIVLNLPAMWRSSSPVIRWTRLAAVSGGLIFVLWLVYAELVLIHAICLWCTVIHVATLVLFFLTLYGTLGFVPSEEWAEADEAN